MRATVRVAAVILAATLFVVRGPLRAVRDSADFGIVYAAARAWVQGGDPYDPSAVALARTDGGVPRFDDSSATRTPYPPATFPLLAPFALLPWRAASAAWLVMTIVLVALGGAAIVRAAPREPWLMAAFVLAFAPLHTGIAKGNLSIAAAMLAVVLGATGATAATGVSAALKPQIGAPFFLIDLLARRWRSLAIGIAVAAALLVAGVVRMQQAAPHWLAGLRANYASLAQPGGLNDPSAANPYRYHLINLQAAGVSDLIAFTIAGALLAAFVVAALRQRPDRLLACAAIGAIILLPLYRRFYDAALLLPAAPWAWRLENVRQRIAFVALFAFLVPGAALLHTLFPTSDGFFWSTIVVPHASWCTLAIAVCAVWEVVVGAADRRSSA
jgi:hypothetical protein